MSETTKVVVFGIGVLMIVGIVVGPMVIDWILRHECSSKGKR